MTSWQLWLDHLISKQQKCSLRVLDTVFVGEKEGEYHWYYTTKHGVLAKKKSDKSTKEEISLRFQRFALANPNNTNEIIAVLDDDKNNRSYLHADELTNWLDTTPHSDQRNKYLQVYLRPQEGIHQFIVFNYSRIEAVENKEAWLYTADGTWTGLDTIANKDFIQSQVTSFSEEIVSCFQRNTSQQIGSLSTNFIIDDNGHVWLTNMTNLSLQESVASPTILPELPTSSRRSQSRESRPTSSDSIFYRSNNVYRCQLGPDDLPGLRAWVLDSINSASGNNWTINLQDYNNPQKPSRDLEQLRHERSQQKKTISAAMLALLLQSEPLLLGHIPVSTVAEFKHRWRTYQHEATHTTSQSQEVYVCGNCHAIAAKLQSLARNNFDHIEVNTNVVTLSRPSSENGIARPASVSRGAIQRSGSSPLVGEEPIPEKQPKMAPSTKKGAKKGVKKSTPAASKKSSVPKMIPPDINMIAKFAAEKDRQQRLLQEQAAAEAAAGQQSFESSLEESFHSNYDDDVINEKFQSLKKRAAQQKPTKHKQRLSDEERLQELERMAALNSMSVMSNDWNMSTRSVMSGTEEQFMMRQATAGDVSQLLERENGLNDKMLLSLKERVVELEKQVASLTKQNKSKDDENAKLTQKLRHVTGDYNDLRTRSKKEMQEVTNKYEMEILAMKEQHAVQLAEYSAQPPAPTEVVSDNSTYILMEQIERLRVELRKQGDAFISERNALQADLMLKIRTLERKMSDDEHAFRETITDLEDKHEKLREETQQWKNKYQQAKQENTVLEQANTEALNTQQKLRADLKNMQQSVNASYRLDTSQAVGIGVDPDTAIRLAEAKFEAKERQLTNRLEFLKSQLAAEVATVEEMRQEVENAHAKQESIRQEYKARLQEAEKIRQQDIESAEQRVEQRYEMRMSELTTLQSKFALMQNQLQDAVHDNEAAKQREQIAKNAASKAQAHVISLKSEIEQLRNEIFELREKTDAEVSKEGSKQTQDSLMRRLDNERQYLKSQLASEITHKNELQTALTQCQQQLADIQKQWAEDVETLKDLRASENDRAIHTEQRLTQHITGIETELAQLKKTNDDLKNGYVKMRDQLRHEQLAVQNTNQLVDRLRDDLSIKMQEIQRYKDGEVSNSELFNAQINAIKQSMHELEQKKNQEIMRLKEDIKAQFMANSELQKDSMLQRHEFQRDQLRVNMKLEAIKIFGCFHRWKSVRLGSFFKTWYVKSTLIAVAKQYKENLNATIALKEREALSNKNEALEQLEERLRAEHAEVLHTREEALNLDHSGAIDRIHEEYAAKISQLEEMWDNKVRKRDAYYKAEIHDKQTEHEQQLENEREKRKVQLEEQKTRFKKELQQHVDTLEQKFYAEKIDVAAKVADEWKDKLAAREAQMIESHESDIQHIRKVHHQELKDTIADLLSKHADEIAAIHSSYAEKEKKLLNEFDNKYAELHHNMQQKETNSLNYLQSQHEEIIEKMRARSDEIQESRIRDLRVEWESELNEILTKKEEEIEKIVAKKAEELEIQFETKKAKLQKLEASKWQQMLKDMEKRYNLEMQQAKQLGYKECEGTLTKRLEELSSNHTMAVSLLESKHQQFVSELNKSHEQALVELQQSLEIRMEEAIHAEKEKLRQQLLLEEAENHRISLEKAKAEVEFVWKGRLNKEQNRLESLKQDLQRNLANYAEEKRTHQQRVDHLENRCQRLEDSCKLELTQCKEEFEKEKHNLQKSFDKQLKAALAEQEAKHNHALQSTITHWKDEIQIQIDITREKVEEQYHEQMKRIQDENDRLISGLESAMDVLKKEKSSLVQELETAMTKLENTEDALYDLQQAYKLMEKKNSFIMWKSAAKFVSMGLKFRTEIHKSERTLAEKFAITNDETMHKLESVILVGMKLSALLVDMEKSRRGMHQVLSSYKTEVLIEKRTQIRLFEKELERLVEERDVLEEQREALEDDITELQEQVREIEEQIREHNHSSSVMPNGRINVAHARKKKRMDTELERILDLIEQKRTQCTSLDERILNMNKVKDDKEGELIDTEKTLVQILIEQQRMVLNAVEDAKSIEEKGKVLVKMSCLPWPPPENPSENDIKLAMA